MRIATSFSTEIDPARAVEQAAGRLLEALGGVPNWVLVQAAVGHAPGPLLAALGRALPGVALHGASSCVGVMTQAGMHSEGGVGLGLLGIRDDQGAYGTGVAAIGDDPRAAAGAAATEAIDAAGRPGETPALFWISGAPGHEEALLEGIAAVVGPDVPIVGGSSADSTVEGGWYQIAGGAEHRNAVVVSALFPSTRITSAFQSGYEPTTKRGRATRASGRTLLAIDGEPAAAVYDAWTGGAITPALTAGGGNILGRTTLFPLGRQVGEAGGAPYFRLAHPDSVTADGGLTLFADVKEGDDLVLMRGSVDSLVTRAGRVAAEAMERGGMRADDVAGALVIFCAGCMLTVREQMPQVVAGLDEALHGAPFLGCFTFGEQGCFVGGENRHGNLMVSVTAFARR